MSQHVHVFFSFHPGFLRGHSHNSQGHGFRCIPEAYLIDTMIKNNISLKEAIDLLNKGSDFSKKDIYNASLNIKNKIG